MEESTNTTEHSLKEPIIISFDIGLKNLACCCLTLSERPKILHWAIHPLMDEHRKTKPNINQMSMKIFEEMDKISSKLYSVDYVLIENQPSRLNGAMKTIQMIIYSYFQYKKFKEGQITDVLLISANKKTADHPYDIDMTLCKSANKYTQRKWKSIKLTEEYIQNNTELKEFLSSYKKKDDICDAFLQAIAWMYGKSIATITM
jgi:hypothetical protein